MNNNSSTTQTTVEQNQILKARRMIADLLAAPELPTRPVETAVRAAGSEMLTAIYESIVSGKWKRLRGNDPLRRYVATEIMPHLDHKRLARRREQYGATSEPSLPAEFWPDNEPIMVAAFETAGTGEWPKAPTRSEAATHEPIGSVVSATAVLRNGAVYGRVSLSYRWRRAWETDARDYYFRARREADKAHAEMAHQPLYWHEFESEAEAVRFINARRTAEKRARKAGGDPTKHTYCYYPHVTDNDICHVIVSSCANNAIGELPTDRTAVFTLFEAWVNTPDETCINRKSNGYGCQYQGMKGDGSLKFAGKRADESGDAGSAAPALHLITKMLPDDLLGKLGKTKGIWEFEMEADAVTRMIQQMIQHVPDMKLRGGGNPLAAWQGACTHVWDTQKPLDHVSQTWVQKPTNSEYEPAENAENGRAPATSEPQLQLMGGENRC
jgi:hypothetical protein